MLPQRGIPISRDNEVVIEPNAEDSARLKEVVGEREIGLRGLGIAARVVVSEDNRSSARPYRRQKTLSRVDQHLAENPHSNDFSVKRSPLHIATEYDGDDVLLTADIPTRYIKEFEPYVETPSRD